MDSPLPIITSEEPLLRAMSKGHTIIAGQTQYGKTTAAMRLFTCGFLDNRTNPCYIFVDTKHDDAVVKYGVIVRNIKDLMGHLMLKTPRIIYRPPGVDTRSQALTEIVNLLFTLKSDKPPVAGHKNRQFALFIDEIQLYAGNQSKHKGLQRLATTGLGKKILMIALGQRIQDINKQVYSQCNNSILFFMREREDYLKNQGLGAYTKVKSWLRTNPYYFAYIFAGDDVLRLHSPLPLPGVDSSLVNLVKDSLGGYGD